MTDRQTGLCPALTLNTIVQENEESTYAVMANMISGNNMVQQKYWFIFERSGSDSLGGGCPIFYLGVTRGATFRNQIPP